MMRPTIGDLFAALLWIAAVVGSFWLIGYAFGWWAWWGTVL